MKRDSNDSRWQAVKAEVKARDREQCRLCKVLSVQEMLLLKKNAHSFLYRLDPAHYLAVSDHPELTYDKNNICLLNRYSHSMLDSSRDPITGTFIEKDEVRKWWERILKGNWAQYQYLKDNGYIE